MPEAQKSWKPTAHPPIDVQHVPAGGQTPVPQTAPETKKFGNEQPAAVVLLQAPAVVQHAPFCARAAGASARSEQAAHRARRILMKQGQEWDMEILLGAGDDESAPGIATRDREKPQFEYAAWAD